jgi:hypothetical protein
MSKEIIQTVEGFNPGSKESFSNLVSLSELKSILEQMVTTKNLEEYISENYTFTVMDGDVVYYVN